MKLKYGYAMSAKACAVDDGLKAGEVVLTVSKKLDAHCACGNIHANATATPYCHGWASDKQAGAERMYAANAHVSCNAGGASGASAMDGNTNITVAHCMCGSIVCKGGDATTARSCVGNHTINDTHIGQCKDMPTTTTTTVAA